MIVFSCETCGFSFWYGKYPRLFGRIILFVKSPAEVYTAAIYVGNTESVQQLYILYMIQADGLRLGRL
jgi:hypothetical protein